MLLPTFQKYLNTRDITNFLMRTSSLDTLQVPDAPVKLEPGVNEVNINENPRASRALVELENRSSFHSRRESGALNQKKEELADDDM